MAKYVIAAHGGASGFRPWQSRIQGVGDYQRANIVIPTESYANMPTPGAVTGGLGQLDLSAIPLWVWLLGAGAGWYFFFGPGRRRTA